MESVRYEYDVDGENFASAGRASESVKRTLKQLGVSPESVRRVAIAMYEGEINMVIHAHGGKAVVDLFPDHVEIRLIDRGPGIADIELAMKAGYSTAPESIRSLGFGAGMGLPNMKKYSDEMTIDSQVGVGTSVYLQINF
ncbi:MAG TPA: ATP-binding protein [Candidatus Borkfalkia avicola]|uniref:ATP-binding protein n=1 Tax=Candidatus Borkfalkia avicola TaxID=2838503 RepID=A0A9D2D705_9FIRM|nr:ATP-binding protein [Candidatus Borkfalkia avicola]